MKEVSKVLEEKGLIRHWWSLDIVARLKGSDKKIHAGEYEMTAAMSPNDMIKKMVSGEVVKRKVTVKEGATIWEIGPLLEQAGIIDQAEFNKAVVDEDLLKRAGINARSFEGYLFPDTYLFSRPITAQRILGPCLSRGKTSGYRNTPKELMSFNGHATKYLPSHQSSRRNRGISTNSQ